MPIAAPVLAAGINLLGQGINAGAQGAMNAKTRRWNEKIMAWQRGDALADWAMQNEYNHPSSQMARLREAKLNPNLVYGTGAVANNAGAVKGASAPSWNPRAPSVDAGSAISSYMSVEMQKQQIDNLRKTNTVLEQEALLKAAQTVGTLATTDKTKSDTATANFDLMMKNTLKDVDVDIRKQDLAQKQAATTLTLTHNEVSQAMKKPTIDKVLQEIVNLKKDAILKGKQADNVDADTKKKLVEIDHLSEVIHNAWLDGRLKDFDLKLKELRGKAHDWPGWMKAANDILTDAINVITGK